MQSQAPTNVDMSTCLREAALPKRTNVDWNWPIWREQISKNRLICKNAVALAYYGSCMLLVMGSCGSQSQPCGVVFYSIDANNSCSFTKQDFTVNQE